MRPTVLILSERVHKPLIHFLGKRQWPAQPEPPHAHPAGPPDYKAHFDDFLKRFQSYEAGPSPTKSAGSKSSKSSKEDSGVYHEFWHAPARLWNPRVRTISEEEIETVLSGGAS